MDRIPGEDILALVVPKIVFGRSANGNSFGFTIIGLNEVRSCIFH